MTSSGSMPSARKWQDQLFEYCRDRKLRTPEWQTFSDRRGGRTAWSCAVTVEGQRICARMWYDGQFINNAKEDAAEMALQTLAQQVTTSSLQSSSPATPNPSHSSPQQHQTMYYQYQPEVQQEQNQTQYGTSYAANGLGSSGTIRGWN